MWERLESVEQVLSHRNIQYPLIILQPGETEEDLPAKIERWKAGDEVEGILGEYEGGEVGIYCPIKLVEPPVRDD